MHRYVLDALRASGVPVSYLLLVFVLIASAAFCRNPANDVAATLIILISMPVTPCCFGRRDKYIITDNVIIIII